MMKNAFQTSYKWIGKFFLLCILNKTRLLTDIVSLIITKLPMYMSRQSVNMINSHVAHKICKHYLHRWPNCPTYRIQLESAFCQIDMRCGVVCVVCSLFHRRQTKKGSLGQGLHLRQIGLLSFKSI